ncbi:hypothetical protein [Nitrosomonas sp.]|uniref:hypothetical protein n=1 Tax=Nitrosomonas sp. TaxID=42353 RepID=UPI0025E456E3|nr:hypothetical protein [Nitrosomonas sp.]
MTVQKFYRLLTLVLICLLSIGTASLAIAKIDDTDENYPRFPAAPNTQTSKQVTEKSEGCLSCHKQMDSKTMHDSPAVKLGCVDCHGGDASVFLSENLPQDHPEYAAQRNRAHVLPRFPEKWNFPSSANPERSYTLLNREDPNYIRFVNPSDYRVSEESCGACHLAIVEATKRSMMSTGVMLWGGASYNNGILPFKNYIVGEAYTFDGQAAIIEGPLLSDPEGAKLKHGVLPKLMPLPTWETVKPGDVFRVFERGGRTANNLFPETGLPNLGGDFQQLIEPGNPDIRQSNRGPGTGGRIAVPVLNIHKTRLNDPFTWFMGTNDQPGDYRNSGCASCHVVYANDRNPLHSGPYAEFGHLGKSQTIDPTINKEVSGHPLTHQFTRAIPTSQCIVCHMHQPNMFMNTFMGYTMWDYESDASHMWPKDQKYPSAEEIRAINDRNPEGAAPRGKWGDLDFLIQVSEMNPKLKDTQFADYHGHGWNFRAIFKRDRKGNLLDEDGHIVGDNDPDKFNKAVHMTSIHMEKGMHCVDCHFAQDNHGNGHIYGEVASAIEIDCVDCHGTIADYPTLRTSGPAAPPTGNDLSLLRNPDGRKRFEWRNDKLIQRSLLNPDMEWTVSLVKDSVDETSKHYNEKSARAKLMSRNTQTQQWGNDVPIDQLAHSQDNVECYACHTSWTTSCGGCHLPSEANWKTEGHHYEGAVARVFATYNPQVARDEMFMLGRHGKIKGARIAPVRSSSALVVSSTNANREKIYTQQPPISSSGFSSQAFNPHFPHTARKTETKTCEDCHLSAKNDNNAIMAQLLLQGTNFINFVGYHAWIGTENGVVAAQVTEWDEPQAVIGSYLHKYAYPDWYKRHQNNQRKLQTGYRHEGNRSACVQVRGEYLFSAQGSNGMQVFDIASIGNKGVSQPIVTGPFSPLGHNTRIDSENATCVALPTNQPIHPERNQGQLMREENQEQPFHPIYNYALITDSQEGLILTDVNTLSDGELRNNFLKRSLTWNENGVLNGARHITIGGHYVYIIADAGLVILNLDDPLKPRLESIVALKDGRASALQFRYLFVTDSEGLKVIEITDKAHPHLLTNNHIPLKQAHRIYLARTYAYIAGGSEGLVIVDIEKPEQIKLYQSYNADGQLRDVRDVIVATTNASLFAYVADGAGGLKILQLTSPESQPKFYGFSPEPKPELIAHYETKSPALSLSKGLDRDRGVDETGHQISVFGRLGSRPLNLEEMQRFYLDKNQQPWFVKQE